MTKDQKLNCPDADLPMMAGEVLCPEEKHHMYPPNDSDKCPKCKKRTYASGYATKELQKPCTVADPIALTPDNAFKWRDWACDEYGYTTFKQAMLDIKHINPLRKTLPFDLWLASFAQPKHYIKAVCLCAAEGE